MRVFIFLFGMIAIASCAKLDSNLYNNDNKITAYQRDNYTAENDFVLDDTYKISDSLIHEFTLLSKLPSEANPVKIYATYVGDLSKIATDTVILYCHGNKWHMDFYWQRTKLFANIGGKNHYGVLTLDYRGYGLSEGVPTEDGMYSDVRAAIKWLKDNGLDDRRFIFAGFSLGTAPVVELSAHPYVLKPARVILQAPFASSKEMVRDASVLNMPASFFTTQEIDNAEKIKYVKAPLLWIHGTDDDFVSMESHGETVYKNYRGQGRAVRVQGANHSDIETTMGFDEYSKAILKFIQGR
jgi:fermentation-respiration switch protein FrsA (DUF1100 family)